MLFISVPYSEQPSDHRGHDSIVQGDDPQLFVIVMVYDQNGGTGQLWSFKQLVNGELGLEV